MRKRETNCRINAVAALWAARVDRGTMSDAEEERLRRWLAADPRRVGAFVHARAILIRTEVGQALGPDYDPAAFADECQTERQSEAPGGGQKTEDEAPTDRKDVSDSRNALSRRHLLWLGGGAALYGMAVFSTQLAAKPRYKTRRGELLRVNLEDGTIVNLNTMSAIEIDYSRRFRTVRMSGGEALFQVASDPSRPFVVIAGNANVEAVGTEFSVRQDADSAIRVMVQKGVVRYTGRNSRAEPALLTLNMCLEAPGDDRGNAKISTISAEDVARELAWQQGRIAFSGVTLAAAAREFARYSDRQIIIPDTTVARRKIVGLFNAHDPEGFARAVADSLGLEVTVGTNLIALSERPEKTATERGTKPSPEEIGGQKS